MTLWQADFSPRPLTNPAGQVLWELIICDAQGELLHQAQCPEPQAGLDWLLSQLRSCLNQQGQPERIQFFRPEFQRLLELAANELNLLIEPTRYTPALKTFLEQQAKQYPTDGLPYQPTQIFSLPPVPLPEQLWGEGWQFTGLSAQELETSLITQPIPLLSLRMELLPSRLGLNPTALIPGVVIYGGRRSMAFARWVQEQTPAYLEFIAGNPDGVIMAAGLRERWVLATFNDAQVRIAAQTFMARQQQHCGLHFLLVQPDDSGVTYTGLWLLQPG